MSPELIDLTARINAAKIKHGMSTAAPRAEFAEEFTREIRSALRRAEDAFIAVADAAGDFGALNSNLKTVF